MVVFVNSKDEIKDVGSTTNVDLIGKVIDDSDNPFKDWATAKICCYKATIIGGKVTMMTPYVDTRILEHIEKLGIATEDNAKDISETNDGLIETYEATITNEQTISECEDALMELYEMIIGE